jgi:hypothetical protein
MSFHTVFISCGISACLGCCLSLKGTIAIEFLKQVPDLDAILVPTSGGGMIAGIAIAAKAIKPDIKGKHRSKLTLINNHRLYAFKAENTAG